MLLSIRSISVFHEKSQALSDVSMEVAEGDTVTIIGANGAGKTTTLRAIAGLKRPASGEIWFAGQRIDRVAPQEIVKLGIAMVPEGKSLFSQLTVMENLKLGAFLRKDKKEIITDLEEVLAHFPRLKERHKQNAGNLSGGEQQMLAIGRALMAKPKLLLLDEPSLGLAPLLVSEIGKIVTEICRGGVSIILVEQNARLALGLADRGYVLQTGSVVLEGDARELASSESVKKAYLGG